MENNQFKNCMVVHAITCSYVLTDDLVEQVRLEGWQSQAYCTSLENWQSRNGFKGSNPLSSAISVLECVFSEIDLVSSIG